MPSPVRLTFVMLALAAMGLVSPVKAVRQAQPANRVLPDFDVRESRPAPPPSPQTEAEIGRAAQSGSKPPRVHPFTAGVRVLDVLA